MNELLISEPVNCPPVVQNITVFTGSSAGTDPHYAEAVSELARHLVDEGIGIVYGGGHVGLMGAVADSALHHGGEVHGVMPQSLIDAEIAHTGLTHLDVVAGMHERKQRMAELADAFVALPGGAGTLEELFETWTWQQLGIHSKPVALYDVNGFWQPLVKMIDHMVDEGFLAPEYKECLIVEREAEGVVTAIRNWVAPASKWN